MTLARAALGERRVEEEATWQAVILIYNGRMEYYVIGLLELVWKVVVVILNLRLTAFIAYQDFLHILQAGHGLGTTTLKAKLFQQLEAMRVEVLHGIFLDLHKAYDTLDRDICLEILEGYGWGPQAHRILRVYWYRLRMVACAGGYYGTALQGFRGVT